MSTSCKSVDFTKMQQVCENQTCGNLIFAELPQVAATISIKFVDSLDNQLASSLLTTCSRLVSCYYKATASDVNTSWYRFDNNLQQTYCNLRVSGCVLACDYKHPSIKSIIVKVWSVHFNQFDIWRLFRSKRMLCDISTKPPVCSRTCVGRTTEIWTYWRITTKIIFAGSCALRGIKTTGSIATVGMERKSIINLPPRQITINAFMTTDIHIFHSLANSMSHKIYDV